MLRSLIRCRTSLLSFSKVGGRIFPQLGVARVRYSGVSSDTNVVESQSNHTSKHVFKAETQRLLKIVADSLYSEKEVFVRELTSNAVDACEKFRHYQLTNPELIHESNNKPLGIYITLDQDKGQFILEDSGVGMTRQELEDNLGTIAMSGVSSFLEKRSSSGHDVGRSIIGQFGVGFYSSFTVGKRIDVYSRSSLVDSPVYCWSCVCGDAEYSMTELDPLDPISKELTHGTRVVVHLRDEETKYANPSVIKDLVKKYSNFVNFPIHVDGELVNTLPALWARSKSEISGEQYAEFFRHISKGSSEEGPLYTLHYSTDAPVQVRALLFVPKTLPSIPFRLGEQDGPGISLYCRKVLIRDKISDLLPQWLGFVRGVVDSEDIPLNLSRELLQNSVLISKIKRTLTSRVIKWLLDEQKKDPMEFAALYKKIAPYIKGGVVQESGDSRKEVAQLLLFESSTAETSNGDSGSSFVTTIKSYVDRMPSTQKAVYMCLARNRQAALDSPYYEAFKKRNIEVLFSYDPMDEFLVPSLDMLVDGKSVKRVEDVDLVETEGSGSLDDNSDSRPALELEQINDLTSYLSKVYTPTRVKSVKVTKRFTTHPALIVDHAMQATTMKYFRQVMAGDSDSTLFATSQAVDLEINGSHPLISGLYSLVSSDPVLAEKVALQIFDNARIEAGLLEESHDMVQRINDLLTMIVTHAK